MVETQDNTQTNNAVIKRDLVNLFNAIDEIRSKGIPATAKFNYAMLKNYNIIKNQVVSLNELIQFTPKLLEFERERLNLVNKYAKRDENNKIIFRDNSNKAIIAEPLVFEREVAELREMYSVEIDQYNAQQKQVEDLMKEESNITLHKINIKDIPDGLTLEQLEFLEIMIDEQH